MLQGWADFYLLIGSAAAALIGLLFVVTTLTAGRERSAVETGNRLFTTPVVFHLGLVLLLSGAAMVPALDSRLFGLACGLGAAVGAVAAVRIAVGISRAPHGISADMFDICWYGIAPALLYLLLLGFAVALGLGKSWGATGVGLCLMGVLLACIHNAWDLVTFLAPKAETGADASNGSEP